jgi:hypothetical protein
MQGSDLRDSAGNRTSLTVERVNRSMVTPEPGGNKYRPVHIVRSGDCFEP